MAWDLTQSPWEGVHPQPFRPVVYAAGVAFVANVLPIPTSDANLVAKWSPTWVQPARLVVYASGDSFSTWLYDPLHTDPATIHWWPAWVQPTRPIAYAQGMIQAKVEQLQSYDLFPIPFTQSIPQPSRFIAYAQGTNFATGKFQGQETTADRWQPSFPQPSRAPAAVPGTIWAAGKPPSIETTADKWQPIHVQPNRPIVYAKGGDFATEISMLPGVVPIDRWQPVLVQPGRPVSSAPGSVANSLRFTPDPYADRWVPTLAQPGRLVVRASGTESVQAPTQVDPRLVWQQSLVVQPGRAVVYASGTDFVTTVWRFPEPILADKWAPTLVQPSRLILRDLGTVLAFDPGGFYKPGDPDPRRGTGAPKGPDPHRGTSVRTWIVRS